MSSLKGAASLLIIAIIGVVSTQESNAPDKGWDQFTAFIGEEVIMKIFMMAEKGYDDLKPSKKYTSILQKCTMAIGKSTIKEMGDRTNKIPTTGDLIKWYENILTCRLKESGISFTDTSLDKESFKAQSARDDLAPEINSTLYRDIINRCVDNSSGATAAKQYISIKRCVVNEFAKSYEAKGHKPCMAARVAQAFYTLWDTSPCSDVQFHSRYNQTITRECFKEANERWTNEVQLPSMFRGSLKKYDNSDVKAAMYFLKEYIEEYLMDSLICAAERVGIMNNDTCSVDYQMIADDMRNLPGWDTVTRDSLIQAIRDCNVSLPDVHMAHHLNEEEHRDTFLLQELKFLSCLAPKFVNICGINNNLVKYFFQPIDDDILVEIANDFKNKKGQNAIMHIIPALGEKFHPGEIENDPPFFLLML